MRGVGAFAVRMLAGTVAVCCGFVLAAVFAGLVWAANCDPGVVTEYTARGNFSELKANQCNWVVPLRAFIEEVSARVALLAYSNTWTNTNDFSAAQVKLPTTAPCDPLLCNDPSEYSTVCNDNTDPAIPVLYVCGSDGWVAQGGGAAMDVLSEGAKCDLATANGSI